MNRFANQEQVFLAAVKRGGKNLFEIVLQARAIHDDAEFWAWHQFKTVDDVESYLQAHLEKVIGNVTVGEMFAVLKVYPNKNEWGDMSIVDMIENAKVSTSKEKNEPVGVRRKSVTLREHEEVQRDAAFFRKQSEQFKSESEVLRQENRELREENQRLRGRIEELERIVRRELISA